MKTNETNNDFRPQKTMMLPHKWKMVGFIVAAVALPAAFILERLHVGKLAVGGCASVMVLGLFVAAMSRDRREDEMLRAIRLASIFHAFCWVVLYVALYPLIAWLFHVPVVSALVAVLSMLVIYHFNFIWTKWRVRREKHD